jgi:hypothetical protein
MKEKTKPLTFTRYKNIVLDTGEFKRNVLDILQLFPGSQANPHHFKMITKIVPKGYPSECFRAGRQPFRRSHPLVIEGKAYWINERSLATGFYLINNSEVYIPVFQPWKEQLNNQLRLEIKYYAKFIVADIRQKLYEKILLCISKLDILPEEIIHKIAHLTYDPKYYLKL